MSYIGSSRFARWAPWALFVVLGLTGGTAAAQSRSVLRELRKLHARAARPDRVLSDQDARNVHQRLAGWKLDPARLAPDDRRAWFELRISSDLGLGDVTAARDALDALRKLAPDNPRTWQWTWLVAAAAGDAKLARDAIDHLRKAASDHTTRRAWSRRLRWIRQVGQDAPDVTIRTEDLTEYDVADRGEQVLVIDFWNTRRPPPQEAIDALKRLYEQYRDSPHVAFVGVNADSESNLERAREFARKKGMAWKQCYEGRSAAAPITHKAFKAGRPPWTVVVDSYGFIRAVGSADEPAFVCALRAAIAEARGDAEPVGPRTIRGEQRRAGVAKAAPENRPGGRTRPGDLPSNPQAASKLRQARAFLKTGLKSKARKLLEEIIRDYPGTLEAYKAREYLETIP